MSREALGFIFFCVFIVATAGYLFHGWVVPDTLSRTRPRTATSAKVRFNWGAALKAAAVIVMGTGVISGLVPPYFFTQDERICIVLVGFCYLAAGIWMKNFGWLALRAGIIRRRAIEKLTGERREQ